ncbi:malate/lactate/ureidoglycolate dehydrogenase [soil metagenome]
MPTLAPDNLEKLVREILEDKAVPSDVAAAVAHSLVLGNLRGHDSHGVIRVPQYIEWMDQGWIQPKGKLEIIKDKGPILVVDGHYQFGQVIGREATDLAIAKTKSEGVCVLTIRRSAHLGRMGEFMEQAAAAGIAAFTLTNTHGGGVLQAAHGGYEPRLSANPLAAAAPLPGGRSITMDFATSITAEGKVKLALARNEQLPEGYLVDGYGEPTTDPATYYAEPKGAILPVASHKGYALAVFADILAGAVGGGSCSHANLDQVANGWFAVFVDPAAFSGQDFYDDQVDKLAGWLKDSKPRAGFDEVLLPGEPEDRIQAQRKANGIPIEADTWTKLTGLASSLGIVHPKCGEANS